tara:strand:+ start:1200 stop:2417 length:1218 start_codon:yes stop_codon:yes gene_type:complete
MNNKLLNYRICEKRIGKGSFSTIHKCFDNDNNVFALKKIKVDKLKDKLSVKNEFNIMRKLSHINIIKVFDLIIDEQLDNVYIFLEYFEYGDLGKYLSGNSLEEKHVNNFSIQIKNGLQYLFKQNIIHRDIKPQNILVSNDKILKIIDFGLSKSINRNEEMMDTVCGSPLYMAPEIVKTKNYTVKSDIWSFGVIIYEMIYGYTPFRANNIYSLINAIDNTDIKYPTYNISKGCINLLQQMLVKEPEYRIGWENLFIHAWLTNDLILNEENKLLEEPFKTCSSTEHFNRSYKYNSISHKIDESFELNFAFESINSNESLYHSMSDSETDSLVIRNSDSETLLYPNRSNPIDIKNNTLLDSFVFINKNIIEPNSNINHSFSENIKGYIHNSIHFVKQSCDYINKSSSL